MLKQKYVTGTHYHPISYMQYSNKYTVHNSYSSAWKIPYKMVVRC